MSHSGTAVPRPFHRYEIKGCLPTKGSTTMDNSLDPQDVGLGVSAGRSGQGGGVLGELTCRLSGRRQDVWSPDGPRQHDGRSVDDPLLVRLAEKPNVITELTVWPGSLPRTLPLRRGPPVLVAVRLCV
jgi:hypothetical protein